MSVFRPYVLNESYFSYYRKPYLAMRKKTRRYSIFEHIKADIALGSLPVLDSISIPFHRCLNNAHSLTSIIRALENDVCFIDEEEIHVSKTSAALKVLRDFCNAHLDKHLASLTLGDAHVKFSGTGYNASTKFVDVVRCTGRHKHKDIIPAFQVAIPFFKKDINDVKLFIQDISELMHGLGYNYVACSPFALRRQPFRKKAMEIVLLLVDFEAVYSDPVDSLSDKLVHVTSVDALESIKRHGILPKKSEDGGFAHPERVYLFSNANEDIIVKFIKERYGGSTGKRLCMLSLDKDALMSCGIQFYEDPMFDDIAGLSAVYATETVPPSAVNDCVKCFHLDSSQNIVNDGQLSFART